MDSDAESTEFSESTKSTTLEIGRTHLPMESIASKDIFQKKLKAN